MSEQKIYGSTKVASDDNWHIGFRDKTLCGQDEIARARGIIEATCPKCIEMYKLIMNQQQESEGK